MSLNQNSIAKAAELLRSAAATGKFIAPLRETFKGLGANDAYAIQNLNTELKLQSGARLIGAKIGLTSLAVQQQLGVDSPDYGVLFDDMAFAEGLPIPMAGLHQPKIEAEVAFVLGRDLDMPNPTLIDVVNAIDYALPALEIVGSRIAQWNIRLVDTVADNASSSAFVLGGSPKKLDQLDLRNCRMTLAREDEHNISIGSGAACLGHPLNAVVWLARTLARHGAPLRAGHLVLSGALGPMIAVEAGKTYTARIDGLGTVAATFDNQ
ncbi:fumarylacetoacetate hydrolase family protein [Pseudomonas sp. N-137]|uniref:2-keto-4-pentenoate hydratase n=1 Tax=Pseudomonas sp. N-137 TaxID=3108452 RepID=UPI002ADEDA43|nr:fumarylacetoacetate hydrolase family protein [Pseudomonas sp. N-137]MEA1028095.1 fumarylacetoacetate hydrolase family protein [Pseudomonas sp. N-137]